MTIQQTSYEPYQWTITAEEHDNLSDVHAFLRRLQGGMKFLECEIEESEHIKSVRGVIYVSNPANLSFTATE